MKNQPLTKAQNPSRRSGRQHMWAHLMASFALATGIAFPARAVSPEMKSLVDFETRANAASFRSNEKIAIEHFEIPLRLIRSDIAKRIDRKILSSLVFEKNGEKYIRWIINPEDTQWHLQVRDFLTQSGLDAEKYRHFEGYQTASRSYIIVDPQTKAEFSVKVSTNLTGGSWKDKKQTYEDAWQIRMVTDYVYDMIKRSGKLKNIVLLDEPAIFGLEHLDQGMVIRDYGSLSYSGKKYVPGFSIMHSKLGRDLAKLNGSDDPAAFWNDHYNKPLARAIAEFVALTGMTYDSPHSQNFLVELDTENRPTGRIVFRDFGDTYLTREFFKEANRLDVVERWEKDNILGSRFHIAVGILHGNNPPDWLPTFLPPNYKNSYARWAVDFHKEFNKEFEKQTGVRLTGPPRLQRDQMYYMGDFSLTDQSGLNFLSLVKKNSQRIHLKRSCDYLFMPD